MKKLLAVLMAVAMMATMLSGCTKKDDKETSADSTTPAAQDEATTPAAEDEETTPAAEEEALTATITVWSPSEDQAKNDEAPEKGEWLQKMCEQFAAEHPNWNLTFEYGVCPEGEAKDTVTKDVEAAADVYMFANDNLTSLVAANAIAKLGGETETYVKETNSQAIVDSVSVDGSVYGVPFTTNTWYMFYDKSVFTEEDVKSLDTMLEKGKVSFPLGDSWYVASFYVANGCTLFGDGTDEEAGIDFSGDKAVAVTNYLIDMVANPNFVDGTAGVGLAGLREGTVSAIFSGSWDYANVVEALGENCGIAVLPTITIDGEAKQMMSFAGSKAIGVNPNTEYPQVAVALAKYLGSAEAQKAHYEARSIVPCNTELLEEEAVKSDALVVAQNATFDTTSIIQPFVAKMGNYWTPAENMGKAIINGEVTHDNAAEKTEEFNTSMNTSVAE